MDAQEIKQLKELQDAYLSVYEAKKVDQDEDGDVDQNRDGLNNFADVMIARMIASGVSKEEAIRRVKDKEYNEEFEIDEGLGSAVRNLFGRKKQEPETKKPLSRGEVLRQRYNVGPEGSDTSAKRQILNRTRERAERDEEKYGSSPYSKSVAQKSRETHNRYLRAGYSKYGANEPVSGGEGGSGGRGGGHRAARRAAALKALNNSYDFFDYMMDYLLDEGYANTQESALVIMANMSEEWRESIVDNLYEMQYTPPPQPPAEVRPAPSKSNRPPEVRQNTSKNNRNRALGSAISSAVGLGAVGSVAASNAIAKRRRYKF
jgi:hypothetical protein